jgi:hypothetical protein
MRLEIPAPGRRTLSGHARHRPADARVDAVNHMQDQRERGADRAASGDGWTLDTTCMQPCGYVIRVVARDPGHRQQPGGWALGQRRDRLLPRSGGVSEPVIIRWH